MAIKITVHCYFCTKTFPQTVILSSTSSDSIEVTAGLGEASPTPQQGVEKAAKLPNKRYGSEPVHKI